MILFQKYLLKLLFVVSIFNNNVTSAIYNVTTFQQDSLILHLSYIIDII